MRHPGEPSIEEILESIKRVIAREDRGGGRAAAETPASREPVERAGEEKPGEDVLDLAQHTYARDATLPAPAMVHAHAIDTALVTPSVSANLRGSLDTLASVADRRAAAPSSPPAENVGLEALVRELLRPALTEWLDRNLPAIVERLVAAEVARIAGRHD